MRIIAPKHAQRPALLLAQKARHHTGRFSGLMKPDLSFERVDFRLILARISLLLDHEIELRFVHDLVVVLAQAAQGREVGSGG